VVSLKNTSLISRVKRAILRHHRFESLGRAGVAVSGGADSVCLLLLMRELGIGAAILHVNHSLRGEESEADEAFVRALAARFDVPVHVLRSDTRSRAGNLEEEARHVRYEFYRESIESGLVDCVATGHTLSDQAETVLFRILRGAHLAGLAAIHPVTRGPVIRPLLDFSRIEIEEYLRDAGEPWREDSSNRDLTFDRNRIRHVLLPELKREWNPEIERSLAQLAALAFDEERFWAGWISGGPGQGPGANLQIQGNIVLVRASKLVEYPVAVARRLIRRAIEQVRGNLHAIDFGHVEAILDLALQVEGSGRLQAPQVDVYRSFDWLRFAPLPVGDQLARRNQETACTAPGTAELPAAGIEIGFQVLEVNENKHNSLIPDSALENARVKGYELDWDRVLSFGGELRLRTWKPGDQYLPAASQHSGSRKLKAMFQEARIPLWDRATWPILLIGSKIVWAREFGPAADVAVRDDSRRILLVRETRNEWRATE
jgi:tRNA(Ile)-lysidine synthase